MGSDQSTSRSEHVLTICCSRAHVDEPTSAQIKALLREQIDWDYLYNFARRHSVLPLVYLNLNTVASDQVPEEELGRLKKYYQENVGRNLYLTNELCRILNAFADEGIEAIPYKGPALALSAYGKLDSRRFVDLDVMVRKADVLHAKDLLLTRGYQCETDWTKAQQALLLRTQHNLALRRDQGRLIVELHWEVAPDLFASSYQAEQLWKRLQPLSLNGFAASSLSNEDLLLSLCIHGSKHLWGRIAWITDVAEMLRTNVFDWAYFCERARATKTERMVFLGLYLAHRFFDAPLPDPLQKKVHSDRNIQSLAQQVSEGLFSGAEATPATLRQGFGFNVRLRENWRAKLRYCRLMFRPTDGDLGAVSLPRSLSFAYYLLRPLRLLKTERDRHWA